MQQISKHYKDQIKLLTSEDYCIKTIHKHCNMIEESIKIIEKNKKQELKSLKNSLQGLRLSLKSIK